VVRVTSVWNCECCKNCFDFYCLLQFGNFVIVFVPGKKGLYLLPIARIPHRFEVRYLSNVGQFFASSLKITVAIFKFLLPMCFLDRCAYWHSSHKFRMKILINSSKLLNVLMRREISLMDTFLCIWVNSLLFFMNDIRLTFAYIFTWHYSGLL